MVDNILINSCHECSDIEVVYEYCKEYEMKDKCGRVNKLIEPPATNIPSWCPRITKSRRKHKCFMI